MKIKNPLFRGTALGAGVLLIGIAGLAILPAVSPDLGANMADALRNVIGVEAVANLESTSFRLQDQINQAKYRVTGQAATLDWSDNSAAQPTPPAIKAASLVPVPAPRTHAITPLSPVAAAQTAKALNSALSSEPQDAASTAASTQDSSVNVVNAPSDARISWEAFGPNDAGGEPIMARAKLSPDATRPYANVAMVRIDLSKSNLNMVAGTMEPNAVKGTPKFPRPGMIDSNDQTDTLLAAFNGGFKDEHGHYGMMLKGITIQPPINHIATLAKYSDGTLKLGAWNEDIKPGDNLVWWRQNCPLLVKDGEVNDEVNSNSRPEWGFTVQNKDVTWRSGLGLSKDGRFLIYAVGNSLSVPALADALKAAGAQNAMQLDINGYYTRFFTFARHGTGLVAQKLLNQMSGNTQQFLKPYDRDFFYLTTRG